MKRNTVEFLCVAVLIGIALGMIYSRWIKAEQQIAQQDARLRLLEAERQERIQFKARAKAVATFAVNAAKKVGALIWKG